MGEPDQVSFHVEWIDPHSKDVHRFLLNVFTSNSTLELYDAKTGKLFLKRIPYDDQLRRNILVGGQINVASRTLRILSPATSATAEYLKRTFRPVLCISRGDSLNVLANGMQKVLDRGASLLSCILVRNINDEDRALLRQHLENNQIAGDSSVTDADEILAVVLAGKNAPEE